MSLGIYENLDYLTPQESKKFFNLYLKNLALKDTYWKYFQEEYLLSLREKQKTRHKETKNVLQKVPSNPKRSRFA